MPTFRKKPVTIEAIQLTPALALAVLQGEARGPFGLHVYGDWHRGRKEVTRACISIETREGTMRADLNDWIIKGVKGELYPCKPDIFAETYDAVEL